MMNKVAAKWLIAKMNFEAARQFFEQHGGAVRTRFAPSPTGYLHLGHVISACFVWATARLFGATVALRIEDHDRGRSRPEFEASIVEDLAWLGFEADFSPGQGSWRQSDRDYHPRLQNLGSKIYPCSCSRSDIRKYYQDLKSTSKSDSRQVFEGALRYPGWCRQGPQKPEGPFGYRLRLDEDPVRFDELWPQKNPTVGHFLPSEQTGDVLVRERSGDFTYAFCVVCDDIDQGINLIVRGQDLIDATPTQEIMRRLMGGPRVLYLHHPLILGDDGHKLSKSAGSTSIKEQRKAGSSPSDIIRRALVGLSRPSAKGRKIEDLDSLGDWIQRQLR